MSHEVFNLDAFMLISMVFESNVPDVHNE